MRWTMDFASRSLSKMSNRAGSSGAQNTSAPASSSSTTVVSGCLPPSPTVGRDRGMSARRVNFTGKFQNPDFWAALQTHQHSVVRPEEGLFEIAALEDDFMPFF